MVTLTRFNVKLHVHCLSYSNYNAKKMYFNFDAFVMYNSVNAVTEGCTLFYNKITREICNCLILCFKIRSIFKHPEENLYRKENSVFSLKFLALRV